MNAVLREKQKKEAVERMRKLNILDQTIKEFEKEGKVNKSEFCGVLYWLDSEELLKVKEFEEEYDALVYHAIKGTYKMCDGFELECLDLLYVSAHEEEWGLDREDIENKHTLAYSISNCCYGEFGTISIAPSIGGLVRVA